MSYFDRAVIEKHQGAADPLPRFVDELLRPAELAPGSRFGVVEVRDWRHDGDHFEMQMAWHARADQKSADVGGAETPDLRVLVRAHDTEADAYLRTPRWNIAYRGRDFDRRAEALLSEVARRLEVVAEARGQDAEALHARYFRRPDRSEVLEVSPGKKLYLRVTDHCDENCVFCNATEGNENIVASKTALRRILDGLPAGALRQVIFSGGEPTLVKALPDYVAMVHERGARDIIIQTNGVRLERDGELERYLPWRDRLGLGFSLHAVDAALSDQLTAANRVPRLPLAQRYTDGAEVDVSRHPDDGKTGRLEKKIAAIDKAVALGFRVKITCVVMKPNVAQVPAFAEFAWERWGERLDRIQFSYAMPRGNAWLHPEWLLSFSECVEPWAAAYDLGRRTGLRVETSQSCTYAPCVMPEYVDHQDVYGDFAGRTSDPERVKPEGVCDGCAFDRICAGVWQRYIDVFGTGELRAITDRPPLDVRPDDYLDPTVLALTPQGEEEAR
jgi:molybdenum cofactor biosynthesis enzyme MoaA